MTPRPVRYEHADREALAETVAAELASATEDACRQRGTALLALAGGSTPRPAYRRLAERTDALDRTRITPTDERWVPADDPASNARMLRETLGTGPVVTDLSQAGRYDIDAAAALDHARESLELFSGPFDLVLLGMGTDGHFASLFPDDPHIMAALASEEPVVVAHPASQPLPRISLTPRRLLHARRLLLVITGDEKRTVLEAAQAEGPIHELPIRAVLRHRHALEVHYSP